MSLYSRIKVWVANEILTANDLNAEFNNIINNAKAEKLEGASHNVTEMQLNVDPGEVGSESLATSTKDELSRLRYVIKEMKGSGAAQWYSSVTRTLSSLITGAEIALNTITNTNLATELLDTFVGEHSFKANNAYKLFDGIQGVDGKFHIPYNANIVNVVVTHKTPGSGGTTTVDVLYASTSGAAYASILTTKPSIDSTAGADAWCGVGDTVTGCTAAVLSSNPFPVAAGGTLVIKFDAVQTGEPEDFEVIIKYKRRFT